jgi:hypothetical protein
MNAVLFNADMVRKTISVLVEPGSIFEIRAVSARLDSNKWKTGPVSGFFNNADAAVAALANITSATSIYMTMNPVIPDLLARRYNRLDYAGKDETTSDQHILKRRWLLIDCDPERPAGISSTNDELRAAISRTEVVEKFLREHGWPQPIKAASGNGGHLLYRIDEPAEDGGLISRVLTGLETRFSDEKVGIDVTVENPSRVTKLYGTLACKGDNIPSRPHRLSGLVMVPETLGIVSREQLEALAAELSPPTVSAPKALAVAPSTFKSGRKFDLQDFFKQHGIEVKETRPDGDQTIYILSQCPFDSDHGGHGEVAVFEQATGQLGFKCHHSGCADRHWRDFRQHFEPDCYQKRRRTKSAEAEADFEKKLAEENDIRVALADIILHDRLTDAEKKQKVAETVVDHLLRRGKFFYHAQHRDFATAMFFDGETKRLVRVQADEFLSGIAEWTGINRSNPYFNYIADKIEDTAVASASTTGIIPEAYWASRPDAIYLSSGDGRMAKITSGGVSLVDNGTDDVLFGSGQTLPAWKLVEPEDPFASCQLFCDMNVSSPHGKTLLKLWMVSFPTSPVCKPPLVATGEIGGGKTRTIRGIAELYGLPWMSTVPKSGEKSQNDFWVSLDAGGLFALDNADTKIDWLADAVATATTGAGDHRRKLYSDKETQEFRPNAWLAMTAANPTFAQDAALADRLLVVRMNRRTDKTDDKALTAEIALHRNGGLSWLVRMLAAALADKNPTPKSLNKRHPDFAEFAVRLGRAMGCEAEAIAALTAAEEDKSRFNLENDSVGAGIIKLMTMEPTGFSGTAAELMTKLATVEPDEFGENAKGPRGNRLWNTKRLGKRLLAIWVHIEALFDAKREKDTAGHATVLSIRPKANAVLRFQTPEMDKPSHEDEYRDFPISDPPNRKTATSETLDSVLPKVEPPTLAMEPPPLNLFGEMELPADPRPPRGLSPRPDDLIPVRPKAISA